jgi:DNA repair exonuclease SbcCD ATPase subunit
MPKLKRHQARFKRAARKSKKERKMAAHENPSGANNEAPEGQNVDKIRDILFGSQMREYEKRFTRLEEQVAKSLDGIREDVKKRLDALEAFTQQEVDSVSARLKNEKSERVEGLKELTSELRGMAKSLEKKLSQMEEQMAEAQGDLRARILEQSKGLSNEIDKAKKEFSAALDREVQTLRSEKTDRAALADLFNEIALRLNNEFTLPDK